MVLDPTAPSKILRFMNECQSCCHWGSDMMRNVLFSHVADIALVVLFTFWLDYLPSCRQVQASLPFAFAVHITMIKLRWACKYIKNIWRKLHELPKSPKGRTITSLIDKDSIPLLFILALLVFIQLSWKLFYKMFPTYFSKWLAVIVFLYSFDLFVCYRPHFQIFDLESLLTPPHHLCFQ